MQEWKIGVNIFLEVSKEIRGPRAEGEQNKYPKINILKIHVTF